MARPVPNIQLTPQELYQAAKLKFKFIRWQLKELGISPTDRFGMWTLELAHNELIRTRDQLKAAKKRSPQDGHYNIDQAAQYCRCSKGTIYRYRHKIKRLPGLTKLIFTKQSLDNFLQGKKK